jgi:predicted O-linked N-acetylglucosamine transferase (SPINDLY family)
MKNGTTNLDQVLQLARGGRVGEAIAACRALVESEPENADAFGWLGLLLLQSGKAMDALAPFGRGLALRPNAPALQFHYGLALRAVGGREDAAADAFRKAIEFQPQYADAHLQLGNALKKLGRFGEAEASLRRAAELSPTDAAAWLNWGVALLELGRVDESVRCFRRAVEIEPARAEAHNILGNALLEQGTIEAAGEALRHALRLNPALADAHVNLGRVHRAAGRLTEAVAEYRAALALKPDPGIHSTLCYALNFMSELTPHEVWAEHQAWAREHAPVMGSGGVADVAGVVDPGPNSSDCLSPISTSARLRDPNRRLRVGFVSPDLVNHAVAYFFEPLLEARVTAEWDVYCYSDTPVPDRVTERLRRIVDYWRETGPLSTNELEAQIREDRIDVLVDLAGHTGRNRLPVFARKAAPIQLTWLGYPNTTGLPQIDYRVTDALSDPVGETECWHSEKLLRLPHGFLCYRPPEVAPSVSELPALSTGSITFASFSNYAKMSDPCIATWAAVLGAVSGSRLVLKSRGLGDAATAERLFARFEAAGVARGRVVLDGKLVSVHEHLKQYHDVDIALDPFPYNGTTTTCEALWMGVPVVALAGATHVSRVGVSLLTQIGHPKWIAGSRDAYVQIAQQWAENRTELAQLRRNLRHEMQRSPLCDGRGFATDFAAAVRQVWREHCARTG